MTFTIARSILCLYLLSACVACAIAPTTFVAVYGQDQERSAWALQIIARSAPDFDLVEVDPPVSALGPVVIQGSSASAEATAKRIAYDLYTELGDWVVVRPVQMTNHSYSKDYIGIYLLDEETAQVASDDRRRSFEVVPSNEYLPTQCDQFSGSLVLFDHGRFTISGTRYDVQDKEYDVLLSGIYERVDHELTLHSDGDEHVFSESTVHWSTESLSRKKLAPVNAQADHSSIFDCSFLQDLDVVDNTDVENIVSVRVPHPDHIVRKFRRILVDMPTDLRSSVGQFHMQSLPAVGREDMHFAAGGMQPAAVRCDDLERSSLVPLEEIKRLARETRIVIVNEGHDRPIHRKFISRIAVALKDEGYTIFAAETFSPSLGEASSQTGYVDVMDGFYSDEPVFGELVRQVKRDGYELRDYEYRRIGQSEGESRWQRASDREEGQANNLVAILEELEQEDRLLVHVGYSHASEVPIRSFGGKSLAWMAARLKEKTGINPLTIDQTGCLSGTDAPRLMAHSPRHIDGQFDLVVGYPQLSFEQGRPMYRLSGNQILVNIPQDLIQSDNRVIVEARFAGEPINTVPVDRLMLWPGETLPLVLPAGNFELTSFEEHSELRRVMNIEVNGVALSE